MSCRRSCGWCSGHLAQPLEITNHHLPDYPSGWLAGLNLVVPSGREGNHRSPASGTAAAATTPKKKPPLLQRFISRELLLSCIPPFRRCIANTYTFEFLLCFDRGRGWKEKRNTRGQDKVRLGWAEQSFAVRGRKGRCRRRSYRNSTRPQKGDRDG